MKTILCTTPIRPYPTTFPPIGSLSILNYLRKNGVDGVEFYNIDGNRPEFDEAVAHIGNARPDVLGISAVVSTAYGYTRDLIREVKAISPDTLVVVGGGLAASAEILLRRAGADICVLGEGEKVMLNLVRRAETTHDVAAFRDIPGLMILDEDGALVNTGYETPLGKDEIYDIDWQDLERSSDIGLFIFDAFDEKGNPWLWFAGDERMHQPHRKGKKIASLPGAKGCVARCTFCHRWDKGIRYIPPNLIAERLEYLIETYNVGFVSIADENFGTDKKWLKEFCETIKRYDILWQVAGMRVNCVDKERLQMMHDAGCATIAMGIESGSARMLQVMEKKVKIENNYDAVTLAQEVGIAVVPELILGMPGECPSTVRETAAFAAYALTLGPDRSPLGLSINYAQALPGTPLYEYGRRTGICGTDLESEEEYLVKVSDTNAANFLLSLNYTNYPDFIRMSWRRQILTHVAAAYMKKFGREHYYKVLMADPNIQPLLKRKKAFGENPVVDRGLDLKRDPSLSDTDEEDLALPGLLELIVKGRFGLLVLMHPRFFDAFRFLIPMHMLVTMVRQQGVGEVARDIIAKLKPSGRKFRFDYKSLRKIVADDVPALPTDSAEMMPLRQGR